MKTKFALVFGLFSSGTMIIGSLCQLAICHWPLLVLQTDDQRRFWQYPVLGCSWILSLESILAINGNACWKLHYEHLSFGPDSRDNFDIGSVEASLRREVTKNIWGFVSQEGIQLHKSLMQIRDQLAVIPCHTRTLLAQTTGAGLRERAHITHPHSRASSCTLQRTAQADEAERTADRRELRMSEMGFRSPALRLSSEKCMVKQSA